MRLAECLNGIEHEVIKGSLEIEVNGVAYDSRRVQPGYLFVCVPGFKVDGHDFAEEAKKNGAVALVVEKELPTDITQVMVQDSRLAMSFLAANFYGQPQRHMKVVGVTGTNGKTTTTHLIRAILEEEGHRVGLCGTLKAEIGDYQEEMHHTTPEAMDLMRFFRRAADCGADYLVMEVSSHALDLDRVACIDFQGAVFTNLTQDHLDYHQSIDKYRGAKLKLFASLKDGPDNLAVINRDDASADHFIAATKARVITYGLAEDADVRAEDVEISLNGTKFMLIYGNEKTPLDLKLVGMFSVYNALAAAAYAYGCGIKTESIKKALTKIQGVPGRYEKVDVGQPFAVIVDYAHTPDGLENVLKTSLEVKKNRLITVFGCGGDRDRGKRPLMGEIAARYSDLTVITSDNPRSEDPVAIIEEIIPGVERVPTAHYVIEPDRKKAIEYALKNAQPGDLVMIAGKGHEDYQLVGDRVLHFDDREVAREILREIIGK